MKGASAEFFERLVVELLLSMGYGGSRKEAGEAIGKAGLAGFSARFGMAACTTVEERPF